MSSSSTLSEKALLIRLSIALPGQSRKDKRLTGEVQSEKHLGKDSGKWLTQIWPEAALKPLKTIESQVRDYHRTVTFQWDNDGTGILAADLWFIYQQEMGKHKAKFENARDTHFLEAKNFKSWVDWAKANHNGTFDPALYDKEKARAAFRFELHPLPVPAANHFSQTIGGVIGTNAADIDARVAEVTLSTRKELYGRIITRVARMVERLKDPDKVFRDTLVENLKEIVALAPSMNLTEDPALVQLTDEISAKLTAHSPDVLRDDKTTRQTVAQQAEDILSRLQGYV